MAFLFQGYQSTDDTQNQKQNIFSAGGPSNQTDGGNATDVVSKTSVDGGSVSRGTSSQGSGGQQSVSRETSTAAPSGGYNPKQAQSAYSRIAQNLTLPTQTIGRAQSQIQAGQQKLQEEANKYAAAGQQQAESYKLDQDTLTKAAGGDVEAYKKTAERLQGARPEVEAFKGLGSDVPDVSSVRDTTRAYAPQAGPSYTAGQSRYDAALLRRSPEYQRLQRQILGEGTRLAEANEKAVEEKTAAQREALSKAYGESTEDIKKRLGGLGEEIVTAAKGKETAEDARRASLDAAQIASQEYGKLKDRIREDLKTAPKESQQYRAAKYLDELSPAELSRYVNIDKDTDWREFIGEPEADRYNRVQGLLGGSGMLTPSMAGAGADYQFDEQNAYKNVLEQITGRRAEADRAAQERLAAIQSGAAGRAGSRQQDIAAQLEAIRPQYDQLRRDAILPVQRNDVAPNLSWTDVLTPEEVAELNALEQDLGVMAPGNYQVSSVNPYADLKAMQDDLARWQQMQQGGMTGSPINPFSPVPRPAVPDTKSISGSRASDKERQKRAQSER